MKRLTIFILWAACWATNTLAYSVGFDQIQLYTDSDRPLTASVWYPSQTPLPLARIAENAAFLGTDVVRVGAAGGAVSIGRDFSWLSWQLA